MNISSYTNFFKIKRPKKFSNREDFFKNLTKNGNVLEIGVDEGNNCINNLIPFLKPKNLFLLDIWEKLEPTERNLFINKVKTGKELSELKFNKKKKLIHNIKQLNTNTNVFFITEDSLKADIIFPDDYFDLIYIDGCHEEKHVYKELNLWWPKIKKNGFLTGDDYCEIDFFLAGCKKSIDLFVKNNKLEFFSFSNSKSIDWAIRKYKNNE